MYTTIIHFIGIIIVLLFMYTHIGTLVKKKMYTHTLLGTQETDLILPLIS